jgi:hypothetical protein
MSEDANWEDLEQLRDKLRMQAYEQAKSYIRFPWCGCTQGHSGHCTVHFANKQSVENVCEHGVPLLPDVYCSACMVRYTNNEVTEDDINFLKELRIKW